MTIKLSRRELLAGIAGLVPALHTFNPADPVTMRVDATAKLGPFKPIWTYFGYGTPLPVTYTKDGKKLIAELSELSYVPVQYRAFHLLCTGEDSPAKKYNPATKRSRSGPHSIVHRVYTEGPSGKPVYDRAIPDRVFDVFMQAHAKPFVTIGFMPEAFAVEAPAGSSSNPLFREDLGSSRERYQPKDYGKWAEPVYQWVKHCAERYGANEATSWYWELWNEPELFWRGPADEYCKLYDYTADTVKRALPRARIGGPANWAPTEPKSEEYMRKFLDHRANGTNSVSGKTGAPLDFIAFHAKGRPSLVDGHVQMGIGRNLQNIGHGFEIVASYPQFRSLPVIMSESDPEGCADCSASSNPQNGYRNGALFPCYSAVALSNTFKLVDHYGIDIEGMLSWTFLYEGEPYFDGFRTLATNGIDKPVLNVFRKAGLMRGDRMKVESSGALGLDAIVKGGVRQNPDIDAMAARSDHDITVMAWNYHDDDVPAPAAPIGMTFTGIPVAARTVQLMHYRIDQTHSNSYTVWKEMGSPQKPTAEQYARLEAASRLELLESPRWLRNEDGKVEIRFVLPRQGVSLLQMSWSRIWGNEFRWAVPDATGGDIHRVDQRPTHVN